MANKPFYETVNEWDGKYSIKKVDGRYVKTRIADPDPTSNIADGAVDTAQLADGAVTPAKFSGTLPVSKGGTGATSASAARTALGAMAATESSKFGKASVERVYKNVDDVSVSSSTTLTNIMTLPKFEKGYFYVGYIAVRFATNTSGRRQLVMGNAGGTAAGTGYYDVRAPMSGIQTYCRVQFVIEGDDVEYQTLVAQNSGSALNVSARMYAVKIPML